VISLVTSAFDICFNIGAIKINVWLIDWLTYFYDMYVRCASNASEFSPISLYIKAQKWVNTCQCQFEVISTVIGMSLHPLNIICRCTCLAYRMLSLCVYVLYSCIYSLYSILYSIPRTIFSTVFRTVQYFVLNVLSCAWEYCVLHSLNYFASLSAIH